MKRTLIALAATSVLALNSAHAADEVQLMHGKLASSSTPYGNSAFLNLAVEVKDLSYNKDFIVHYSIDGGSWELAATDNPNTSHDENDWTKTNYRGVSIPGRHIFQTIVPVTSSASSIEYAIEYVVDGDFANSYVDNNNGNNYTLNIGSVNFGEWWAVVQDNTTFGMGPGYAPSTWRFGTFTLGDHEIYTKDMGSQGQVYIRYTLDGWATWSEQAATYVSTANGILTWSFDLGDIDNSVSEVEYAIRYSVNGSDHWDNNLTENYSVNQPN